MSRIQHAHMPWPRLVPFHSGQPHNFAQLPWPWALPWPLPWRGDLLVKAWSPEFRRLLYRLGLFQTSLSRKLRLVKLNKLILKIRVQLFLKFLRVRPWLRRTFFFVRRSKRLLPDYWNLFFRLSLYSFSQNCDTFFPTVASNDLDLGCHQHLALGCA